MFDFRFLHPVEKLTRIGGKAFHIAPLSFRIKSVERKRGFSGTAESGDDRQTVAGNPDVNIFQIVLGSTSDDDIAVHCRCLLS